ncbi:class I SAM-dependent methyltransferase [Dyella jejuensis]|uniref:Class I SAM-dependent methyltransferase n=2 Tax=Dyella jejuensis TaxID=1432009 RepID=A0ABW8JKR1_9GAMM
MKIEQLLGLVDNHRPIRLLEVGTGSGGIAHYFGTLPDGRYSVDAVDIYDSRLVKDGYRYTQVEGTVLPFPDASFDVVLTNHVIEHVGERAAQLHHLEEVRRVLKQTGVAYLAVPNRWMLIEPHYRLAFLSWLPSKLRTPYLKWMDKGELYDCEPLQMKQLERMLDETGFKWKNLCLAAWRATLNIEHPDSFQARLVRQVPDFMLFPVKRIIPTLIYRMERG